MMLNNNHKFEDFWQIIKNLKRLLDLQIKNSLAQTMLKKQLKALPKRSRISLIYSLIKNKQQQKII
jgi:hypothetical protein